MERKLSKKQVDGHQRRVAKLREDNPEFFQDIGSIGGNLTTTKYTSESGRNAANKRWEAYRREQLRKQERREHEVQNARTGNNSNAI